MMMAMSFLTRLCMKTEIFFEFSMLLSAISLLFSFFDVISAFQFSPFNEINQNSKSGNILDFSDGRIRRISHHNEVVDCRMEDIMNSLTLDDLESLIHGMASRTAINPFLILRKLHRRMLNRDGIKEIPQDTFDDSSLTEAPAQSVLEYPPESQVLLKDNRAPYSLSSHASALDSPKNEEIIIVPAVQSSTNIIPNGIKMGHVVKDSTFANHNGKPVHNEMSNMLPGLFLPTIKYNRLKEPLGAIVHIDCGDPLSPITREITVTVSPLMTVMETLRQVERKYQNVLGLNDDSEIITFSHSAIVDCYVVNSIVDVVQNEKFRWKLTVMDRDSKVVYDSFCLPNNEDVLVKPGSQISLTYVSL